MAVRTRLSVAERRGRLIALGEQLFSERPFDEISIDDIAARAEISKGLLYHYFGSKRDFYVEVVRVGVQLLRDVTAVPASVPEPERTLRSLDAYLAYVDAHAAGYLRLMGSGGGADPEVAEIIDGMRREFAGRVLEGLRRTGTEWGADEAPPPLLRAAVRGWVGMVEGASLDWVAHRDVPRATLARFLLRALASTVLDAMPRGPEADRVGARARLSTGAPGHSRDMSDTETTVLGADASTGDRGELLLARTPKVALRLWEGEDAGEQSPEHANDYDYVAYVLSGALRVRVGDAAPVEVRAGDSYAVPAGTPYAFEVTETAKVVEAVAPGGAV